MEMYILFCHIFMPEIKRSRDKMRKMKYGIKENCDFIAPTRGRRKDAKDKM